MKAAILLAVSLMTASVWAQPGPIPPPPNRDVCNMNYQGGFERDGGRLAMYVRRINFGRQVQVTVDYRNTRFTGFGYCDDRGISFDGPNGYYHQGRFEWGNRGVRINGTLTQYNRFVDRFFVYSQY